MDMNADPAPSTQSPVPEQPGRASVLQLAQSGDRTAFTQLVEQHQARVFGVALRLTGSHADADEIAQDVFVQLHGSMARIESPRHLMHWLLRTVTHRAIDRLRQKTRQGKQLPLESLGESADLHAPEAGNDPLAAAELQRLLLQLQPDARAAMILRYQEDLDPADIAVVLEMPVATVKSHLRRSLAWLRTQYAGETHGS
jgi:RNA polymerase sigma-70 factor (ECF subfamily)